MKSIKILAAFAAFACLWACKPDEPEVVPATVSVSPSTVPFEADGGTFRVAVTTNRDTYTVSGAPEWIKAEQNGMEIVLTAEENTVNESRACTLTVKVEDATAAIEVSQKAGSPYKGYTVCSSSKLEYGGTILYQFMKPTEEDYGGWAMLSLTDEDNNILDVWIYTDLFLSEEEIELTTGTYVKGDDDYANLKLAAKKLTFMPGIHTGEDDDDYISVSFYTSVADGKDIAILDGTVKVSKENNSYIILADMIDETGAARKCVFTGDVEIDATGAGYPGNGDRIDVANTVFGAQCYYFGDKYGAGAANFQLYVYSGDPEGESAMTVFEFNAELAEYSEDMDIAGVYTAPGDPEEDPEALAEFSPGTTVLGSLVELMPGFSMPMGSYVMYGYDDYLIGDAFASLMLTRADDGTYSIAIGAIMSGEGESVMFFGVEGLTIPIIDGTAEEED